VKSDRKEHWLHIAEVIDATRVIPRLFLTICLGWTIWLTMTLVFWYCSLPKDGRGIEASGFGAAALWATFAFLNKVYDRYTAGGRDWTKQSTTVTSVTATQTNTAPVPTP
jgi:hypothetical protein